MIADADVSALPPWALLIGERFVDNAGGGTHTHIYAATGKPTAEVPLAGVAEIDAAVAAGRGARAVAR